MQYDINDLDYEKLSPMMRQYLDVKSANPGVLLFFRLGDFYELFFDDAKLVSRELDLVLTGRDCGLADRAPMCGVPYHSADTYISKLVERGYKVAICEQLEDPKTVKGIVKRDITRIITPGTVIEANMLDEGKNNYLACVYVNNGRAGLCFSDVSTGEVHLTSFSLQEPQASIAGELSKYMPSEVLYNAGAWECREFQDFVNKQQNLTAELLVDELCSMQASLSGIRDHFGGDFAAGYGLEQNEAAACALGISLNYLARMQKASLSNIKEIDFYSEEQYMRLDASARRNLELTETMRSREKRGTLLWVLDKTNTAMGKRLLRTWIEQPLLNCNKILSRQNAVGELVDNPGMREDMEAELDGVHDLERLMARVIYETANARELRALAGTFEKVRPIKERLGTAQSAMLKVVEESIDTMDDLYELISSAIDEEPPFSVREGGLIKTGFHEELDSLRAIVKDGKGFIAKIEEEEKEKTGIKKLKIGYNRVFGYYIEVSNSFKAQVPEHYIRKQTLANCERYITQELKALESKVLGAQERSVQLEYQIFAEVRQAAADQFLRINQTARAVATLDALCSLAKVAFTNQYVCPHVDGSDVIQIVEGRHPVVEMMLDDTPFVPNDTLLDCGENRCSIITGPNMAGKSTYMRQVALIVVMAQIGSFVPAKSARLGLVDSVFTRVGAADDLASGQSTFMVEMNEVAAILQNATEKSLIVFDEIGRGTSTFDGMSIARAVLEYAADRKKIGAKTLFATHYHELTELEGQVSGVKNYNIAVRRRGGNITFLRRIVRGGADGSYGIDVAKLAGVPARVVSRARVILKSLEEQELSFGKISMKEIADEEPEDQVTLQGQMESDILADLRAMNVETLTPIEALKTLDELVRRAKL